MKKWLVLLITLFLVACSPTTQDPTPQKVPIQITFLHYFSEALSGGINDMVAFFNQGQDIYVLEAVPLDHEAFKLSIVEDLESGTTPDVFLLGRGSC